jgi:superfamily II DNA or RNA helicase
MSLAAVSSFAPPGASREIIPASPTPRLTLFSERLSIDEGSPLEPNFREIDAPLLRLDFDYGELTIRAGDPRDRVALDACRVLQRDHRAEMQARVTLESFGAVDLACADNVGALPGSEADYLIDIDVDLHALCSFSAHVLPQLRALGWEIDVHPSYRWNMLDRETPWVANVESSSGEDGSDWFSLELGVDVGDRRINILPALLDLLDVLPSDAGLDALRLTSKRFFALPTGDDSFVPVPPERLRTVLRVLQELYRNGGNREAVRAPAVQAISLAGLDTAFAGAAPLAWEGDTELRDRATELAGGPGPRPLDEPSLLRATLRPYQREGLGWLQHLRAHGVGGILADDMGLGKTLQTIAHLATEKEAGRLTAPALIVAPTSLVGNWEREINKFAPHLEVLVMHGQGRHERWSQIPGADVVITTYQLLVRDLEEFKELDFYYLICDEAQTIKNARSRSHRAVKQIEAEHKLCISGTPVENNLEELWALFDVLMPGLLGDAQQFRNVYRNPIERGGVEACLETLRERVAPFILRRVKESVATELPPKTEIVRMVDLQGKQRDLYESIRVSAHARVRRTIRQKGIAGSTIAILDALMKLRQVCCDPRLVSFEAAREVEESAKYELLFELLDKQLAQGRRILIFSQFTSMLALISGGLSERGVKHVSLTGSTADRQKPIDAFQKGQADVFLISLKAGGTGLNLTEADTVIHVDPWWNPAAQAQATDRAYRIGQKKPVFVYNLIVAGSVEERMMALQRKKRDLADSILAGGEAGVGLAPDDVEGLFAPLPSSRGGR